MLIQSLTGLQCIEQPLKTACELQIVQNVAVWLLSGAT